MKYADFIKGNEGFQYSINIQYDLMNLNKIKGYIPTRKSIEILNEYLLNLIVDGREKSTVLIGPYGKGKSHLILVLLALMCGNSNTDELNELVDKIKLIDDTCAEIALDVLNNKKYLPVVINFNSGDLNQAFLIALNQALKDRKIQDMLPDTYFDSALNVLEEWEKYSNTITLVEDLIREKLNIDLNKFKRKLKLFDANSYQIFKQIFKQVTSGIEFNPLINTDVVKLYEETNYVLREKYGFDGMIIVFDEFSKFIESNTDTNSAMNLKILQDFAELSSRSKSPQIHLVCVTHKTINEYISKIPQEKIDAWRAIEGRFKEVLFNTSSQQNYELISNAIIKDSKKVKSVLVDKNINEDKSIWKAKELFSYTDEEFNKYIIEGCFPLSPYSTYILPIISEKVAQNERTLFTYLSKDESNSLIDLISSKSEFDLITIDKIYDYFEPLFRKEKFNEYIYNAWLKTNTALKIVYSDQEKKILKALCIIHIVNDFKTLPPTEEVLSDVLDIEKDTISESINNLRNINILVLRKSNETLDFIPISSVDINSKIANLVETKFRVNELSDIYNELVKLKYILPKRYNDEYKITRFFRRTFMTIDQILAYTNAEKLLDNYETDGLIIDLICKDHEDSKKACEWISLINDNRIILVIPKKITEIENDIAEYNAIKLLKADKEFLKEDIAIESQLDILFDDIVEKITNYIEKTYDISCNNSIIHINNISYSEIKSYKVSMLLSDICKENFVNTPIINNELINKNKISAPIKKARNLIVDMLLKNLYLNFDYSKNSVECTLFRSTLVNKGLLRIKNEYSDDIKFVLKKINMFIVDASEKEISFEKLYVDLTSNSNKIGLRRGIIPIYLAFILKDYMQEAIIYLKNGRSKKEVILDKDIIENINNNPSDYLINIEKNTIEKDIYINSLLDMFSKYLDKKYDNKYLDVIQGMRNWFQSLSLFAQNHKNSFITGESIGNEIIKLRSELVKYEINYRSFIFEGLLKYLKVDNYNECLIKLRDIKEYLDNHDSNVRRYLIKLTKDIIDKDYKGTLTGTLIKWYTNLTNEQKEHLYNSETNKFMQFIQQGENSEVIAINKLAQIFTGLSIEDWNDNSKDIYLSAIAESKALVEEYKVLPNYDNNQELIKIIFEVQEDKIVEKTFTKTDISPIGSTLFNAIEEVVDEYGYSIDDNEKRNILMNVLSKYI